jgi:hypothetical protein
MEQIKERKKERKNWDTQESCQPNAPVTSKQTNTQLP